jgi:hydrogenase-4 component B
MSGIWLALSATGLLAVSGVPAALGPGRLGRPLALLIMGLAAVLGIAAAIWSPEGPELVASWGLPWGRFAVGLDPLSGAFLLPVFLIPALAAIHGSGGDAQHRVGPAASLFQGLLPAAMAMVVLARDGALLLLAWEVMAISAFFLITTDDQERETRLSGWVYFVATHVGTLALLAMFALLRAATGSLAIAPLAPGSAPPATIDAIFVLALIGFGAKAGLMPLHVWLPGAHANAPSHVSAVLSGVMLKMGVYGLIRITSLAAAPPAWWGATLLAVGGASAVLGLAFALGQHDVKRVLAYSSIENVGIIAIGVGLALLGRSADHPAWTALGMGGAILHVWNHGLFKPLLFLGAGAVVHGTGTRQIDRLGGLARSMPRTAFLFLLGAVAICALPPLNGFVSELCIVLGLFHTLTGGSAGPAFPAAALAIPALGLAGGLAAAVYARLFGAVFLGEARSADATRAHEPAPSMLLPMAALAAICLAMGVAPGSTARLLDGAIARACPGLPLLPIQAAAPLGWMPLLSASVLMCAAAAYLLLRRAVRRGAQPRPGTWDCGYAEPGPRMQYTGSSLAQALVGLFSWILWPRVARPSIRGLFPGPARHRTSVPDTVLDRAVLPAIAAAAGFLRWVRLLQQGRIQIYLLYFLLAVLALFAAARVS